MPPTVTASTPDTPVTPECSTDETCEVSWETKIDNCTSQLQQMIAMCKTMVNENKQIRKEYMRVSRELTKRQRKKVAKQAGGTKAPSGFAKPAVISKELAKFLGVSMSHFFSDAT